MENTYWINIFTDLLKEKEINLNDYLVKEIEDSVDGNIRLAKELYDQVPFFSKKDFADINGNLNDESPQAIKEAYLLGIEAKNRKTKTPDIIVGRRYKIGDIGLEISRDIIPVRNNQLGYPESYRTTTLVHLSIGRKNIISKLGKDFVIADVEIRPERERQGLESLYKRVLDEDEIATSKRLSERDPKAHLTTLANTIKYDLR